MAGLKTATVAKKAGAGVKGGKDEKDGVRKVLYPTITVCGIEIPEDEMRVSADDAKALMGWETESEHESRLTSQVSPEVAATMNVKFGTVYDLKDYNGELVRCSNNTRNRPLDMKWVQQLAMDILNDYWRFNGESWIIGQTGMALSLQHRAIALIWAEQIRSYEGDDEDKKAAAAKWQKVHPEPLYINALVVRGVEETPDVTRTLDNVRPRSLSDVLFADTSLFQNTAQAEREKLCKLVDFAIRTVQKRTGEDPEAFDPRRSHSKSLEFLSRHPRLMKAASHIHTELKRKDSEGELISVLGTYITPGTAAGLMFLMGASGSDRERWDNTDQPNDRHLDFDNWDKAAAYWTGIGDASNRSFEPIRKAISSLGNAATGAVAPVPVKIAVLVNGWDMYLRDDMPHSFKAVYPEFGQPDDKGRRPLAGMPSVGGIDLGDPVRLRKEREEEEAAAAAAAAAEEAALAEQEGIHGDEPTEDEVEEVETAKEEVKKQGLRAKANGTATTGTPKKAGLRGGTGK